MIDKYCRQIYRHRKIKMEGELWGLHGKETGDDSGGEDRRDQLNFKHVSTALHLINSVRHSSGA